MLSSDRLFTVTMVWRPEHPVGGMIGACLALRPVGYMLRSLLGHFNQQLHDATNLILIDTGGAF